jgi:hypothetical protein
MARKAQAETPQSDRITVRLQPEQRRMLNDLRRKEDDVPDAAEMVRRLIERAVKQ